MGHLDLALWSIRQSSPELSALVARYTLLDRRPSQAPYMLAEHPARADPLVERFERWARCLYCGRIVRKRTEFPDMPRMLCAMNEAKMTTRWLREALRTQQSHAKCGTQRRGTP
jgi:hypothetical protein